MKGPVTFPLSSVLCVGRSVFFSAAWFLHSKAHLTRSGTAVVGFKLGWNASQRYLISTYILLVPHERNCSLYLFWDDPLSLSFCCCLLEQDPILTLDFSSTEVVSVSSSSNVGYLYFAPLPHPPPPKLSTIHHPMETCFSLTMFNM